MQYIVNTLFVLDIYYFMKIKQFFILAFFSASVQVCLAQEAPEAKDADATADSLQLAIQPLFVLKLDGETLEIDPAKEEQITLASIDPKWIKSITIQGPEESLEEYGERGKNGVITIEFLEQYLITKESLLKLKHVD